MNIVCTPDPRDVPGIPMCEATIIIDGTVFTCTEERYGMSTFSGERRHTRHKYTSYPAGGVGGFFLSWEDDDA